MLYCIYTILNFRFFSFFISLQGTRFELSALMKFNMTQNFVSSYYITLVAYDPDSLSHKDFQVRVDEKKFHSLDVVVSIAKLKKDQDEGD